MKLYTFEATLIKHPQLNSAFIEFPYDVEKEFGKKGQVKVVVTFDGIEYRGSLARMGHPCHCIGITQEIRKTLQKNPGDKIQVTVLEDLEPRIVEIPADFLAVLSKNPAAQNAFEKLSYTHQKEYVRWVTEAKKQETRNSRIQKGIEMLQKGTKTPL